VNKRALAITIIVFLGLLVSPLFLSSNFASAQTGYSIVNVGHEVNVLYSGNIVIIDTIRVSGNLPDQFVVGYPQKYDQYVLKAFAFNLNHEFPVSLNASTGQPGIFGALVTLNSPAEDNFEFVLVLSNALITQNHDSFNIDFPLYPALPQEAGLCVVNVKTPSDTVNFTAVSNGQAVSSKPLETNSKTVQISKANMPAYTNAPATASFSLPNRVLLPCNINSLDRVVTVSPVGVVTNVDSYRITNISPEPLTTFQFNVPLGSTNIQVYDDSGRAETINTISIPGTYTNVNVSVISPIITGQSLSMSVQYNSLPAENIGSKYQAIISQFPYLDYYVASGTLKFSPPQGASIAGTNQVGFDQISKVANQNFQDTLTLNRQEITFADTRLLSLNSVSIFYEYNPVWSSLNATIAAFIISVVACIAIFLLMKRQEVQQSLPHIKSEVKKVENAQPRRKVPEEIGNINDFYEERAEVRSEMKVLEDRVQRNKIPRRQYKMQHETLEHRDEKLTQKIEESKEFFRNAGSNYPDLVRQLDSAEEKLTEANENLSKLELQKSRGEIPLETYRTSVNDYQRQKDKAQNSMHGILLRLREKAR
jgi:hypothetical protein